MKHPSAAAASGTTVGAYTILQEIASGGMATVFLARRGEGSASRLVAVKRLHPHLATEEDFVTMFFDEARLAARIQHPNVVRTLQVDDVEGLAIVMEYVEGPTLLEFARDQSRRGAWLPRAVISRLMLDLLAGLHAAHELCDERGAHLKIVHRDVSPHNVLVGVDGRSRIADFGIAKATVRLTSTDDGQRKGKIAYMAPELITGETLDRRADIFSAGVVLWELLTAHRLFAGTNEGRVVHALMTGDIPTPRSVAPTVPEALEAVVMRALARDPAKRWSTAAEFAQALAAVSAPAAHAVIAAFAARAFANGNCRPKAGPVTLAPTPPSTVRRVSRRERDESLDATVMEVDSVSHEDADFIADAPAQDAPAQDAPAQDAPAQDAPAQDAPAQDAPAQDAATASLPASPSPAEAPVPAATVPVDVSAREATEEAPSATPVALPPPTAPAPPTSAVEPIAEPRATPARPARYILVAAIAAALVAAWWWTHRSPTAPAIPAPAIPAPTPPTVAAPTPPTVAAPAAPTIPTPAPPTVAAPTPPTVATPPVAIEPRPAPSPPRRPARADGPLPLTRTRDGRLIIR